MSNVSLTMVKGAGGVLYNSSSLMAEALHSLGDLFSDFITLWAYRTARSKKADKKYPYGFGKIEPLGGLTISSLLIGGSVGMAIHSFHQLQDILHGPMLSLTDSGIISPWAAVLLVASIGVKEWLYRITLKVGKKTQSSVLIANAYHHRSDVYSSVVALAGVAGASMGYGILDPIGGLVVSAMILKMGVDSAIPSFKELMDIAVPDLTLNEVHQVLGRIKIDKNIHGFHSVRGRKMGPFIHSNF
jgi:cation diffusion facilitator family transporter